MFIMLCDLMLTQMVGLTNTPQVRMQAAHAAPLSGNQGRL
jgi:hypothetical protein